MAEFDTFDGRISTSWRDSRPWWPSEDGAESGRPNVIVVLYDDLGFSHFGCYGSTIATPTVDSLANGGLRFTGFHVTALCSPSRAALMTGRNHHAVGMGTLNQFSSGYPGYSGWLPPEAGTLPKVLQGAGYSTFAVGKWHLAPASDMGASGPFDRWPLGQGFDRYYGFLQGKSDHWRPEELVEDNHYVRKADAAGYHLTEDLVDHAIGFVRDQHCSAPERPFYLYLSLGAVHAPHHARRSYIDRYRGAFDAGWDETRSDWFQRQKDMGIVPADTELPERNPGVPAWNDISPGDRAYTARQQEVFAGFLQHTDEQVGRLIEFLQSIDELEDTIVLVTSDNGAAAEGGPLGSLSEERVVNGVEDTAAERRAAIDSLGGPTFLNTYSTGWAMTGNNPLRWYKHMTHGGGVRSPLVVHWPRGIRDRGGLRDQFTYITDILPTILEWVGVRPPREIDGVPQMPLHGTSFAYAASRADQPGRHELQYFEIGGHRGIYLEGWKAVARHLKGTDFADDQWELYHLPTDFNETRDLAESEPARLAELVDLWWQQAWRHNVLPLDDRRWEHFNDRRNGKPERLEFALLPGASALVGADAPDFRNRSYEIVAELESAHEKSEGVLLAAGSCHSGLVLYVSAGRIVFDYNYVGRHFRLRSEPVQMRAGSQVSFRFTKTGDLCGVGELGVDGVQVGSQEFPMTLPSRVFLGGVQVGRSTVSPVDPEFEGSFDFDGVIRTVVVTLEEDRTLDQSSSSGVLGQGEESGVAMSPTRTS